MLCMVVIENDKIRDYGGVWAINQAVFYTIFWNLHKLDNRTHVVLEMTLNLLYLIA